MFGAGRLSALIKPMTLGNAARADPADGKRSAIVTETTDQGESTHNIFYFRELLPRGSPCSTLFSPSSNVSYYNTHRVHRAMVLRLYAAPVIHHRFTQRWRAIGGKGIVAGCFRPQCTRECEFAPHTRIGVTSVGRQGDLASGSAVVDQALRVVVIGVAGIGVSSNVTGRPLAIKVPTTTICPLVLIA